MGKLIVIEGIDGSGKATQAKMLYEYIKKKGKKVRKITFPNYKSPASSPVKMYLEGEFGKNADSVNPYSASVLFAVDRFASYKTSWSRFLNDEDSIVIADRYVTSNMIHQASKIPNKEEREKYLDWLYDLEYVKMELPKPDAVLFLDVSADLSRSLIKNRANKIDGSNIKDIHENDFTYLTNSYNTACEICDKYSWVKICCEKNNSMDSKDNIFSSIINQLEKLNII